MDPVQITWEIAGKVWWAVFWRSGLISAVPIFVVNVALPESPLALGISFLLNAFAHVAVFKWWVLGKNFGYFELWPVREISK